MAENAGEKGLRVLIAEDDSGLREIMTVLLEDTPHDIRFAPDGGTVLELAENHPPDVVVVDLGLPDMDGYDVARNLRERNAGRNGPARLIAFTGFEGEQFRQKAELAGFDEYRRKPMDLAEMEETFRQILGG